MSLYCRQLVPSASGLDLMVPCGAEAIPGSNRCLVHALGVRITSSERRILMHLLKGQRNKEIANAMNLSERTVKFHVSNLLQKFRVESRTELVLRAGVKLENAF